MAASPPNMVADSSIAPPSAHPTFLEEFNACRRPPLEKNISHILLLEQSSLTTSG